MKKAILFILAFAGTTMTSAQSIDTLAIKAEVAAIKTFEDQVQFIYDIYWKDQTHRGAETNDSIDLRNLIAISYFINAHGYPKLEDHGRTAAAPSLIWTHNKYDAIDRITFPIIRCGFLSGEIREKDLRLNYLRGLYHRKYDNNNYRTLPLKELFTICEVNLDSLISVKKILEAKAQIDSFNRIPIAEQTLWKSKDRIDRYTLASGEVKERTIAGEKIRIFTKADGKIYLQNEHIDRSGEPRELEQIAPDRYKYKGQETNKFFAILDDRVLFGDSLLVFRSYDKIEIDH